MISPCRKRRRSSMRKVGYACIVALTRLKRPTKSPISRPGLLQGKAAALVIRKIVDTIHTEYPQADESAYLNIGLMLDEGSIQDSLYALPTLVEGVDGWQAASLPEIGDNAVWLWGTLQGKQSAFCWPRRVVKRFFF